MCIDKQIRDDIKTSAESYLLVTASAGTGKTTIMIDKLKYILKEEKINSYQKIVLTTFTRAATQQIRDKIEEENLSNYDNMLLVITNNGFVLSEVVRPFLRDAYGKSYPRLEEITQNFSLEYKFDTFNEGLKQLEDKGIVGTYKDTKKDFLFELALNVLKISMNAKLYIKAKYPLIFLDEYQDSGLEMHNFFQFLKNECNSEMFIVGDEKQAIYSFKGSNKDYFISLESVGFKKYELVHNFRSDIGIIHYANNFLNKVPFNESDCNGSVKMENSLKSVLTTEKNNNETITFLLGNKYQYKKYQRELERNGFVYMEDPPLSSDYPNYDVLSALLRLYHDEKYYKYHLIEEVALSYTTTIINTLTRVHLLLEENNTISDAIELYGNLLERNISEKEISLFEESLSANWKKEFSLEKPQRQVMTIHKSKGLDFDCVIVIEEAFYYKGKFKEPEHYVAITRPKKRLYIIIENQKSDYIQRIMMKTSPR